MSGIKGKVGAHELAWERIPSGPTGLSAVVVAGVRHEVKWRRDEDGIWIELAHGVFGFDLQGERNDAGKLEFRMSARTRDGEWAGVTFVRAGEENVGTDVGGGKKGLRVRAQMPGKIIRVLVGEGAEVAKDQPLLVMEAMKMENEIRASVAGKVSKIKVSEGQSIETGADLILLGE